MQPKELLILLNKQWREQMKNNIIGYTSGVFDLFHIGHLNILEQAKRQCDYLIVGVTTDQAVEQKKGFTPFIPFEERLAIIKQIKYVDEVYVESDTDKIKAWEDLNFDKLFKGSDWKDSDEFKKYKHYFETKGVEICFFPYTKTTSSTQIREIINRVNNTSL